MGLGDRKAGLLGAVVLHAAAAGLGVLAWKEPEVPPVKTVPVTLITEAPPTPVPAPPELRSSIEPPAPEPTPEPAPEPQPAPPAPEPAPEPEPAPKPAPPPPPKPKPAPPKPPPPKPTPKPEPPKLDPKPAVKPAPKPTPPAPTPKPKPKPTADAPKPAPAKPAPAKPAPATPAAAKPTASKPAPAKPTQQASLDLDALADDLARDRPKAASKPAAPKPASRPASRPSGGAPTAAAVSELTAGVRRRIINNWTFSCELDGLDRVDSLRVKLTLTPDGRLARPPEFLGGENPTGSRASDVLAAAALRAINLTLPFSELPTDRYTDWREFTPVFRPKQVCASR